MLRNMHNVNNNFIRSGFQILFISFAINKFVFDYAAALLHSWLYALYTFTFSTVGSGAEPRRQTHFGTLLAPKMRLVTTTLVVLCDRFRIQLHKYAFITVL